MHFSRYNCTPHIILYFDLKRGFPDSSAGKESTCNAGDPSSIPGSERSTGEGIGYPLQYSWASLVTQLVKKPPTMQETWVRSLVWEDPLEKGKAIPTPVFWPGEFHELYSPWGCKESDTTEWLSLSPLTSRQLALPTSCSQGCSTAPTVLSAAAIGLGVALALTWTWLVMLTLPPSCCFCHGLYRTPASPICPSSISTSVPLCPDCTTQVIVWCPQALLITKAEPVQYHSFKQSKITEKVNKMSFLTLDADKERKTSLIRGIHRVRI